MYSLRGKAAIISDLHLGSVICLQHQILSFLNTVHAGEYSLLVIAGDLLESTETRMSSHDWKVLSKIRKMTNDIDVVWIYGNHDAYHPEVLGKLLGCHMVENDYRIVTKKREIICIHGHQFDMFIAKHPIITTISSWIYLAMQRIDRRHRIAYFMKKHTKNFMKCSERIKIGLAKTYPGKFIAFGHTHKAELCDTVVNMGSWTDIRGNYVEIDEDSNVILKTWQLHL